MKELSNQIQVTVDAKNELYFILGYLMENK